MLPVVCTESRAVSIKIKAKKSVMEVNSPVISFRSNSKRSSVVCLDVKGIQAGWSGELDKLYFLKYKARF